MSDSPDRAADPCAGADLEAESLPTRSSPDAKVTVRGSKGLDYKSSGLADLCLTGRPGDWVEFSFTTGAAQRLATITLNGGPDGGAVELELAGTPVGQVVDTFRPSPARITLDLDLALTAGEHTLRMTITDPTPPRHVTCQVAVDYLSLSD